MAQAPVTLKRAAPSVGRHQWVWPGDVEKGSKGESFPAWGADAADPTLCGMTTSARTTCLVSRICGWTEALEASQVEDIGRFRTFFTN